MTSKNNNRKPYKDQAFLDAIGKRLQELLTERGITHEVFYFDTEINPHRYIAGKHNMTMSNFKRICDYFKITPEEYLKGII